MNQARHEQPRAISGWRIFTGDGEGTPTDVQIAAVLHPAIRILGWRQLPAISTTTTGIEIGNAVGPEDHGLAINDELLCSSARLPRSTDIGWSSCSRSVEQPYTIAVTLDPKLVAVIFDFVEPIRAVMDAR